MVVLLILDTRGRCELWNELIFKCQNCLNIENNWKSGNAYVYHSSEILAKEIMLKNGDCEIAVVAFTK
jgi:hypothetical protein